MQRSYYRDLSAVEHQPRQDHTHEVRHQNGYGATVTTRHYSHEEATVEQQWRTRTAHGYRVEVVPVVVPPTELQRL